MELSSTIEIILLVVIILILICIRTYPEYTVSLFILLLVMVLILLGTVYFQEYIDSFASLQLVISNPRVLPLPDRPELNSLTDAQNHINNSLETAKSEYSSILSHDSDRAIVDSINHSIQGGKRLRGSLALDVAANSSCGIADATETALALEYLHAASLIIDDMPHFDNDDIRRGKPSAHILYGAATSQMAATGLISLAMECLIRQGDQLRKNARTMQELARVNSTASKLTLLTSDTLGVKGAAGGQLAEHTAARMDQGKPSLELLENIIRRKTGALFEAGVVAGWIIGTSMRPNPPTKLEDKLIREAAYHYGMAFQIADDIGDEAKDIRGGNGNVNYCAVRGRPEAQYRLEEELRLCREKLEFLGLWSPVWEDAHQAARLMVSD